MPEAIRKHKVTQAIRKHRRSLTIAATSLGIFAATVGPSFAYVYNG